MPLAVGQFDLSSYDLVIFSSHAVAKRLLTGPDKLRICMCYLPIRCAWDLQHQYLRESDLDTGLKELAGQVDAASSYEEKIVGKNLLLLLDKG